MHSAITIIDDIYSLSQYKLEPTVLYADQISSICSQLDKNSDIEFVGTKLILNNGLSIPLTNAIWAFVNYLYNGFDKIDAKWSQAYITKTGVDFPNTTFQDPSQIYTEQLLNKYLYCYHPYRVIRKSNELTLIYTCITREEIRQQELFYKKTIKN